MSKFAIDEDEMDDLGEGLDSLSEVYDDVETPCPVPAFGHPSLDEAYREFADCIPEFPRRSPGVFTLHHKLFSSWKRSESAHRRIVRILGFSARDWESTVLHRLEYSLFRRKNDGDSAGRVPRR